MDISPPEKLQLDILEDRYRIHRFPPDHAIPEQIYTSPFYSISKTEDELSIVCSSSIALNSPDSESGWSCIKVLGPLDFSLTGILADISAALAAVEVSIFAISTFDTDYILIKTEQLQPASEALRDAGYRL